MNLDKESIWIYLLNAGLLFAHQTESAYWKEWVMFKLPFGLQTFLLVTLLLYLLALWGFMRLVQGARAGYVMALLIALAGIAAFFIHMGFILHGHQEFTLSISYVLLVMIFIISLIQGALALKRLIH